MVGHALGGHALRLRGSACNHERRPPIIERSAAPPSKRPRRRVERRLAAILAADVAGYSRLMGTAEEATHRRVGAELGRLSREIARSNGRVFSVAGDGLMAEFASVIDALKCALRCQADSDRLNAMRSPEDQVVFRMGLSVGEIVVDKERIGGTTVNLAARLESLCEPGGVVLSDLVLRQVQHAVVADYEFLGHPPLKNLREQVGVYQIGRIGCARQSGGRPWAQRPAPGDVAGGREYRPSIAILPFRARAGDDSAYVAEGIVEDVIHALGALKELVVVARSSVQDFAHGPLDLRRVGQALDVRYILHGSVRKTRSGFRFTVELDEAQTGTVVWVDRFEDDAVSLFELQDRVRLRVAQSLTPHLRRRELDRASRKPPESLNAFDLTLRALELFYRADRPSMERAGVLLRQAVAADPSYAPAYSHLAALHMRSVGQGWSEDPAAEAAVAAQYASSSLAHDGNDAVALAISGHVQSYLLRNYAGAMSFLDRAMAAGPNCALAWGLSSLTHGYMGQIATSVERAEWALRLCPLGPDLGRFAHYLSQAYYIAGREAEAAHWGRTSAMEASANTSNLRCLVASLVAVGEIEEARYFASGLLRLVPGFRVSGFLQRTPLPRPLAEPFADRLRQAGLPD